jgi:hypothetical protein
MPVFLEADDLDTIHQVIKKESIDPEDQIFSSYSKDENHIPIRAVLSVSYKNWLLKSIHSNS